MKVDFEDRKYWKTQKCNNLIKPVDLLVESTSDVLSNFVFIFHWDDGWSNRSNWVEIHWDDAQSIWLNLISLNPLRWCLVESVNLGGNPLRWWLKCSYIGQIRPIPLGINYWLNWIEIHWNDGQIRWKSIEMMPGWIGRIGWLNWVKMHEMMPNLTDSTRQAYNVISIDFHPIWPGRNTM